MTNPFFGIYSGEYVDQNGNAGQMLITVSTTGSVSGTYANSSSTGNAVSGQVDASGRGLVSVPGGTTTIQLGHEGNAFAVINLATLTLQTTGTNSPKTAAVFMMSNIIQLPGANPFVGTYAGTFQDTTQNQTDALALNIDAIGDVTGSAVVSLNGTPTLSTVTGSVSMSGSLKLVVQSAANPATGTVTLSNRKVTGALTLADGDGANLSLSQIQS